MGELEASKSNIKEIQYPSRNEEGDFLEWWVNAVKGPKSQRQPHSRYTVKFVSGQSVDLTPLFQERRGLGGNAETSVTRA